MCANISYDSQLTFTSFRNRTDLKMLTSTLILNPFSHNNLLNPKPGEKQNILNRSRSFHKITDVEPYYIRTDTSVKPTNFVDMTNVLYMSKFGSQIPFKVPPLTMLPIVGGFVNTKCRESREDNNKMLSDAFEKALKDIQCSNLANLSICEELVNFFIPQSKTIPSGTPVNHTTMTTANESQESVRLAPDEINMKKIYTEGCSTIPTNVPKEEVKDNTMPEKSEDVRKTKPATKDEHGKPPVKKPKLSIKPKCKVWKKKSKRRNKCKISPRNDAVVTAPFPEYLSETSLEAIDDVDCGIVLSNRFAPLDNSNDFHMWCESDSSESPILNMLNEMHLDDCEIEFDNGTSTTEICDVHSYKQDDMANLACNSSIAFILNGNDDIISCDSDDESFASDLEEAQWQSFKSDFEYFQGNFLEDIVTACENVDFEDFPFQATLQVAESNNGVFVNDVDCRSEHSDRLQDINRTWNEMSETPSKDPNLVKVRFAPDCSLTEIHSIPSDPEEREARKGQWDQCYLDRCRFQNRIRELEPLLSVCLRPQHRKAVFERLHASSEATP